jgi:hypothetical protein
MLIQFRIPSFVLAACCALLLAACGRSATPTVEQPNDALATIVAATLTANVPQATATPMPTHTPTQAQTDTPTITATPLPTDTLTPTPTPPANNVTGQICYPGGDIPAMTVYFEQADSENIVEMPVAAGQSSYEINLPPGTYIAYAWTTDYGRGGLYSRAVTCGLKSTCKDHAPQTFSVDANEQSTQIDLCDWQAGPFSVPYPPGKQPTEVTGSIAGSVDYPGGETPGVRVFAFNQETHYWYWVRILPGQSAYLIDELPAGTYHVVAYDEDGRAGGFADASHTLKDVIVKSGETTKGVDVADWSAPAGSFPADPTK